MKKYLLLLCLLLTFAIGKDIKLKFNISGGNCKHIEITDIDNKTIEVTHERELQKAIKKSDSQYIKQIKAEMKKLGETDIKNIKAEIEALDVKVYDDEDDDEQ